jgi:tetratricopeptide (TPR) repeat protein
MRPTNAILQTILIATSLSAAAGTQTGKAPPQPDSQGQLQDQTQSDPLAGRWQGVAKTVQGQQVPVVIIFRKDESGYSGAISSFEPNRPMVPFQAVKYDNMGTVETRFALPGTAVLLRLMVDGDNLQGTTTITLGNNPPVALTYELKRQQGSIDVPGGPTVDQVQTQEYDKIRAEKDPAAKMKLIEDFLRTYPQSRVEPYVLQEGALLGASMNNMEMMSDYGEKSLAALPNNLILLTELGSAYVHRKQIDKAEEKASKALELIEKTPKPPRATEEQWATGKQMMLTSNFSTLGFVHLNRAQSNPDPGQKKIEGEKAIPLFMKSLELTPSNDYSLYGLGLTYAILNDYPNAEAFLAKAAVVSGPLAPVSRSMLESLYKKQHNNSLNGLDQVLAKAKAELANPQ